MFVIQSFAFLLWPLNTFCIQGKCPIFSVPTSSLSCSHAGMIFQCASSVSQSTQYLTRLVVFVNIVPSFQNGFVTTTFMLAGFPQHIMCFVVHTLSHRWSMAPRVGFFFDNVAGDGQDVVSRLQLSIRFCRLHAFVAWRWFRKARCIPCCPCW